MGANLVGLYAALALTELLVGIIYLWQTPSARAGAVRWLMLGIGLAWLANGILDTWFSVARALRLLGLPYAHMSDHPFLAVPFTLVLAGAAVHLWAATRPRFAWRFVAWWFAAMVAFGVFVASTEMSHMPRGAE